MAGISSMAESVGWGEVSEQAEKVARMTLASANERSGSPMQEVAVQGKPVLGTFLGVELRGENVIPSQRAGKANAVIGFTCAVGRIGRLRVEAVDEVVVRAVRH